METVVSWPQLIVHIASTKEHSLGPILATGMTTKPAFAAKNRFKFTAMEMTCQQEWFGISQQLDSQTSRQTNPTLDFCRSHSVSSTSEDFHESVKICGCNNTTVLHICTMAAGSSRPCCAPRVVHSQPQWLELVQTCRCTGNALRCGKRAASRWNEVNNKVLDFWSFLSQISSFDIDTVGGCCPTSHLCLVLHHLHLLFCSVAPGWRPWNAKTAWRWTAKNEPGNHQTQHAQQTLNRSP